MNGDIKISGKRNLARYSTLRLGGTAEYLAEVYTEADLISAMDKDAVIIGRGSNVLFGDVDGLVVINRTEKTECDGCLIRAESGVGLPSLSRIAAAASLTGLEWACGIPGSVGGAIRMNASAFGHEISDVISRVKVLGRNGAEWIQKSDCEFSYRKGPDYPVIAVEFALTKAPREKIKTDMDCYALRRFASQPRGFSLGSVFKNPSEAGFESAGYYIEKCGLKGYVYKGLKISERHANFIINIGGATPKDFLTLTGIIKSEVYAKFGIMLENEFRIVGEII